MARSVWTDDQLDWRVLIRDNVPKHVTIRVLAECIYNIGGQKYLALSKSPRAEVG
jgi:hypothetical protein